MAVYPCDYYFGVGGDDGSAGTAFATRWRTFQKALDTVVNTTPGTIVTVGMVGAGETITARQDDDTNQVPAGAQIRFIALEADGSYQAGNATTSPSTYWLDANSQALSNTVMFRSNFAGVNNKSFIGLGFKNCLGAAITCDNLATQGVTFIRPRFQSIGTNCIALSVITSRHIFINPYVIGCATLYNGGTAIIELINPVIVNAAGATGSIITTSSGTIIQRFVNLTFIGCVSGFTARNHITVHGLVADRCTGNFVLNINGANVSVTVIDARITNCTNVFSPTAATNIIYAKRVYMNGNTNKILAGSLGVVSYSADCVDMASDGLVNSAGQNINLLNGATPAEGRWLADYIDGVNAKYTSLGLSPNPDFSTAANTRNDTTDGVTGTQTAQATDEDYLLLEEARNKFKTGSSVADILLGKGVVFAGVDNDGTYSGISAPAVPLLGTPLALSPTSIRVYFSWSTLAQKIYLERSADNVTWGAAVEMTSGVYQYDDTVPSAGVEYFYRARAWNSTGYSEYCTVVSAISRTTAAIEQTLWSTYKTKMQADSYLTSYIQKWKFDKAGAILAEGKFPVFKSWILDTSEDWKGVSKSKIVRCHVIIHGLVKVKDSTNLEAEKLKFDEYVKNALESDMTFAGGVTMNVVGDTIFSNLDDSTAEIFITAEILSNRFTAGQR